ncbi:MAG: hypothetical protein IPG59_22385 [Candidatus Melainabacteria bacterium]|nr:MAG: hypothetical protein IPG59_22385 [Candidatus Melainabacteria bacterium]
MFLQNFARLLAFKQKPYILFLMFGLYIGIVGYTVHYLCMRCEETRAAQVMEIAQASPQISDQFAKLVFDSAYAKSDSWTDTVHSMMTRKAQAKFDQIFLSSGSEIYQNGKIALVPWNVSVVPNISNCPIQQVVHCEQRGTRISCRMLLIEVSKNNMPCKEFTLDLKLRKKHGKILIADINVSNALDGTTFENFLSDANVIENLDQFNNSRAATVFYAPSYTGGAPRLSSDVDCASMALSLNPKFALARLQRVKFYIFDGKFDLAEKDLLEARKYCSGPECERLLKDYAHSLQILRKSQLTAKN